MDISFRHSAQASTTSRAQRWYTPSAASSRLRVRLFSVRELVAHLNGMAAAQCFHTILQLPHQVDSFCGLAGMDLTLAAHSPRWTLLEQDAWQRIPLSQ